MKQVIDGKRYNTDKADCVYEWDNGCLVTDFHYYNCGLFRTDSGRWFYCHENYGDAEHLEAITDAEAFGWLQDHSKDSDALAAIERYFSDRIEDA